MSTIFRISKKTAALAEFAVKPPILFLPHEKAQEQLYGFITANIQNHDTPYTYFTTDCPKSEDRSQKHARCPIAPTRTLRSHMTDTRMCLRWINTAMWEFEG